MAKSLLVEILSTIGIVLWKLCSIFHALFTNLVREALCWLIENNPLYKNVRVSEENLASLRAFGAANNIPSVSLTDEEAQKLRIQENQLNCEPEKAVSPPHQASTLPATTQEQQETQPAPTPSTAGYNCGQCCESSFPACEKNKPLVHYTPPY
ncbi:hypothetical protein L915_01695 [Phytophthora nicotianae]|uniref:DUF6570 domain-containing protein n=1 Tax=Phytophthora nicotianae TaxID=4792 RepID=W2HJD2_PHYNI|nr:hypothetical protein L915_01695 [Phytophthora nicotianae]